MGGGDVRIAGRAIEVEDAETRRALLEEVEPPEPFHLFRTELTEVVRTYIEDEKYLGRSSSGTPGSAASRTLEAAP